MANPLVDLTTLAYLKAYMGQPVGAATTDAAYAALITAASTWAASYCSRAFIAADYNDRLNGTGTQTLMLPRYPVISVTSVTVLDGAPLDLTVSPLRNGYMVDGRLLVRTGGSFFPYMRLAVQVAYRAGFETSAIPDDLQIAVCVAVVARFNQRNNPEIAARTIANETISYTTAQVPASALAVFNAYRNVASL